jgi:hypothetical protein
LVSDVPQGPDWWRASNGLYYPPEARPGSRRPADAGDLPADAGTEDLPSPPDEEGNGNRNGTDPAGDERDAARGGPPTREEPVVPPVGGEPGDEGTDHALAGSEPLGTDPTLVGASGAGATGWDREPGTDDTTWGAVDDEYDDGYDEEPGRRGWMLPVVAGAVLLAVLVGGGVWWLLAGDDDDPAATTDTTADPDTTDTTADPDTTDTTEDPTTTTEDTGEVSAFDLGVGDCFDTTEVEGADGLVVTTVVLVDCDEPHRAEVFAVETFEAESTDPFPGTEERDEVAQTLCEPGFEEFVGVSVAESELVLLWLAPTAESWEDGDREVTCAVAAPDDELLEESVAGSGR